MLTLPHRPLLSPPFAFRGWSTEDIPSLVTAWRDPEMHRWMPEEEEPFDDQRAGEFVAAASRLLSEGTMLAMAISDEANADAVAGSLSFNIWTAHHWNVGYWISAAYRGRGLATEAVTAATRWAFADRPELSRISLYTLPGNVGSQRVAERAGFHREGTLRKWAYVRGHELDWTMFSFLREDLAPRASVPDIRRRSG